MSTCQIHSLIVDCVALRAGKVLLLKYKDPEKYDGETGWFLPDDSMKHFEHPEIGAKRVLKEQVGLTPPGVTLSFIESFKGDDESWHLAFHYKTELDKNQDVKPSQDIGAAEWFELDNLPDHSQFAHHGWGLSTLREIMRRG